MQHRYFDGLWDEEDVVLYDGTPVRFMLQSREPSADLLRLGFLHAVAQFHPEAAPVVRALSARLDVPEAALGWAHLVDTSFGPSLKIVWN